MAASMIDQFRVIYADSDRAQAAQHNRANAFPALGVHHRNLLAHFLGGHNLNRDLPTSRLRLRAGDACPRPRQDGF